MEILNTFEKINKFIGTISDSDDTQYSNDKSCNRYGVNIKYGPGMYLTKKGIIRRFKIELKDDRGKKTGEILLADKKITPIVIYPSKKIYVEGKIELELTDLKGVKRMMNDECMTSLSKFKIYLQSFEKAESWFDGTQDDVVSYHKLINLIEKELKLKTEKLNNQFGWIDGKFSPYDVPVFIDDSVLKDLETAFEPKGNKDIWLKTVEQYRTNIFFETMFMTALASPMLKLFNLLPWWLHASGKASTGKTASLIVCESLFGDPKKIEVPFNVTIPGYENRCNLFNNLPVFLNDSQNLNKNINPDQLVYMGFEGRGKVRANATQENRKVKTWCNNTITTGEKELLKSTAFEGAAKRCIQLDGVWMDIKLSGKVRQFFWDNYGHLGRDWIEIIKNQKKENIYKLSDYFYEKINTGKNIDDNVIQVGVMCICKYLYNTKILNEDKETTLEKCIEFGKFLLNVIANDVNTQSYDMCNKIMAYLKSFVAQNYARFSGDNESNFEQYGFIYNENVCFYNNKLNEILIKEFNYDVKLFRKEIKQRNLVVLDNTGQIKKIRFNKTVERYPQFLAEIIFGKEDEKEEVINPDIFTVKIFDKNKTSLIQKTIRLNQYLEPQFYFNENDSLIIPPFTNEANRWAIINKYKESGLDQGTKLSEIFQMELEGIIKL